MFYYVTPKEIHLKIQNFLNKQQMEGSYWHSGGGRYRYRELGGGQRYVLFFRSCGNIKTVQRPEGEPYGYGSRVRVWKRFR